MTRVPQAPPGGMRVAPTRSPRSVLFACSENAVRSPMAEALARRHFEQAAHVASVGVRPGLPNGFVTAVMGELGLDVSHHAPHRFEELEDTTFDLIVTLSPEAHHRALEFTRSMAVDVVYWPTFDPTAVEGSRSVILDAFRGVRDALQARIRAAFEPMP